MKKKIIFTGGGTAGHVTPNIAMFGRFKDNGWDISYIGSYEGMEKGLVEQEGVPYYGIATGKFRRGKSFKELSRNFTDIFRVMKGIGESKKLLKELKPDVIFSKGGFVSVPVVKAAKKLNIPVVIHESDLTPGLANKLSYSAATKICCNFPETLVYLPEGKAVLTGSPIRQKLFEGDAQRGRQFSGMTGKKPILLIIGGSSGAQKVNDAVRNLLPTLLEKFQVIHLCGKGKKDDSRDGTAGYIQYEYISDELPDLFAAADLVISRAGANAICELLALKKPMLLIPLSTGRGDQILNADSFEKQGFANVLDERELSNETLLEAVNKTFAKKDELIKNMEKASQSDAIKLIYDIVSEAAGVADK